MFNRTFIRTLLVPIAVAGAFSGTIAGCGDGGIDKGKLEDVKKQGEALQNDAAKLQADAEQVRKDIETGKITAAEGQKKLETQTKAIEDKAKAAGSDAIDAVKDNKYLSDADKKQLEDAQSQLGK